MVTNDQVQDLRKQLEQLRSEQAEGQLDEQDVWTVMKRASSLLDDAAGSPLEPCLDTIFALLSSIWSNTRNQTHLQELRNDMGGQ